LLRSLVQLTDEQRQPGQTNLQNRAACLSILRLSLRLFFSLSFVIFYKQYNFMFWTKIKP
jgi:hypothetical protein